LSRFEFGKGGFILLTGYAAF